MADSINDGFNIENERLNGLKTVDNSLYGFARSYTIAYSCCYIISPFFGLQNSMWGPTGSVIALVGVGVGLLAAVFTRNRYLLLVLGVAEAAGCVAHFLHIVPWTPVFSDTAYVIMSLLDLTQSLLLFMLLPGKE